MTRPYLNVCVGVSLYTLHKSPFHSPELEHKVVWVISIANGPCGQDDGDGELDAAVEEAHEEGDDLEPGHQTTHAQAACVK